jgi:sugar O-acyltransferase (sialic acid O-acetyltransferase NeuD family)
MRVLILGAGDHGQVVADALLQNRRAGRDIDIIGYLDDDSSLLGQKRLGLPVLGSIAERNEFAHDAVIVGIGQNSIRARIFQELARNNEQFVNAIHPAAVVAPDVQLGVGVVIMAGVVVNTGAVIGDNAILNTSCSVDHHGHIAPHAHLAPGVHLGGRVTVGEGALLGVGAAVSLGCCIGDWAIVGAGGCVISDVPGGATVVGVPAKLIKK